MQPKLVTPDVRKCGTKYFSLYACGFCGMEFQASLAQIKRTANLSCGCTKFSRGCPPARQWLSHMPGDVVEHGHRVVALKTSGHGSGKKNLYECAHCGGRFEETKGNIRRTRISCGCIKKPGPRSHGESGTRLYTIWNGMRERCTPGRHTSKNHGDRGIRVCDEWKSYRHFRDWAKANGYSDTLTIDRIDVNGNYEPSNCRWATRAQQARNTRVNTINEQIAAVIRRLWEANMDAVEIGRLFGLPRSSRSSVRRIGMGYSWGEVCLPKSRPKPKPDPLSFLTAKRTM